MITILISYFSYHILATGEISKSFTTYTGTADYMSFIIIGAAIYLLTIRTLLGISRSLMTERREGTFESLLITPMAQGSYFLGATCQWLCVAAGEMAVMLLIAWPLGLRFVGIQPLTVLMVLPTALLGVFSVGVLIGAIILLSGDTYIVQNTCLLILTFLGGFSFPPAYLPLPLQWVSTAIPITGAVRLLRAGLLDRTSPAEVLGPTVLYTILGIVYTVIAFWLMSYAKKRIAEGKA